MLQKIKIKIGCPSSSLALRPNHQPKEYEIENAFSESTTN
jgi:hypothetical protein